MEGLSCEGNVTANIRSLRLDFLCLKIALETLKVEFKNHEKSRWKTAGRRNLAPNDNKDYGCYNKALARVIWKLTIEIIQRDESRKNAKGMINMMGILASFESKVIPFTILLQSESNRHREELAKKLMKLESYGLLSISTEMSYYGRSSSFVHVHSDLLMTEIRRKYILELKEKEVLKNCLRNFTMYRERIYRDSIKLIQTVWRKSLNYDKVIYEFKNIGVELCWLICDKFYYQISPDSISQSSLVDRTLWKYKELFGDYDLCTIEVKLCEIVMMISRASKHNFKFILQECQKYRSAFEYLARCYRGQFVSSKWREIYKLPFALFKLAHECKGRAKRQLFQEAYNICKYFDQMSKPIDPPNGDPFFLYPRFSWLFYDQIIVVSLKHYNDTNWLKLDRYERYQVRILPHSFNFTFRPYLDKSFRHREWVKMKQRKEVNFHHTYTSWKK